MTKRKRYIITVDDVDELRKFMGEIATEALVSIGEAKPEIDDLPAPQYAWKLLKCTKQRPNLIITNDSMGVWIPIRNRDGSIKEYVLSKQSGIGDGFDYNSLEGIEKLFDNDTKNEYGRHQGLRFLYRLNRSKYRDIPKILMTNHITTFPNEKTKKLEVDKKYRSYINFVMDNLGVAGVFDKEKYWKKFYVSAYAEILKNS